MIKKLLVKVLAFPQWFRINRAKKRFCSIGQHIYFGHGFSFIHPENISIGDHFSAENNLKLQTWPSYEGCSTGFTPYLQIGSHVSVMSNCQISCMQKVTVGNGVLMGDNVFITDNAHGNNTPEQLEVPPLQRTLFSRGPVVIGDNVWLGRNVCVMPGVTIGAGAIIGANAVVTHDIPAYAKAAGVPARII